MKDQEKKLVNINMRIDVELKTKLIDLENRSRRNNLRMDGIPEKEKETNADVEKEVRDVFEKIGIRDATIERAHRTGRKNDGKPRTIVLKLLNYKKKISILSNSKKLKNTGIYINEDFAKETVEKRKKLWEDVKELRRQGKYAILSFDKIVVRDKK